MLIVPEGLPAKGLLEQEGIHLIGYERAIHQDIRPLRVLIFNLMPDKMATDTQLLRLLSRTPLQIEVELLHAKTHQSRHTPKDYLATFYVDFEQVKGDFFDALIITGAPLGHKSFCEEGVDYWQELCEVMEWSRRHVLSTLHICWGALAGLHHHYQVEKVMLPVKLSGVFDHRKTREGQRHVLTHGFDDHFLVPHSRISGIRKGGLRRSELLTLAESEEAGPYLMVHKSMRQVFVMGHPEYDRVTLAHEYRRDKRKRLEPSVPANYFPHDDPGQIPRANWQSHAQLLYSNWVNYIYQATPASREDIALVEW